MQTNNYQQRYHKFIKSRPIRMKVKFDGCETHHILPKKLGGSNDPSNTIVLTFKEHWIAHRMLIKCYTGRKKASLVSALFRMANHYNTSFKITGKRYEYAKQLHTKIVNSKKFKKLISDHKKKNWNDPEYRKKRAESMAKAMTDPNRIKRMSEAGKMKFQLNPGLRKMYSDRAKAQWAKRKTLIRLS